MTLGRLLGLGRSLLIYHAIPLRARRLARLYAPFVPAGSLCFDIGAHAGNRVRCWRRLGARVVAVEPQPDFAAILRRMFRRDPLVSVVQAAVGATPGTARLLVSERTPAVSTLSGEWARRVGRTRSFRGVHWASAGEVEVTTLQALVERHGSPHFIKIDVEGYEARVLEGLAAAVPGLSFEYLPAAREVALACVDRLCALGPYRYNWSPGESHRLASGDWLDADGIRRVLEGLREADGSGDVYASLQRAG